MELTNLISEQPKACSSFVDEIRIQQRLQYIRQRDSFVKDIDLGKVMMENGINWKSPGKLTVVLFALWAVNIILTTSGLPFH